MNNEDAAYWAGLLEGEAYIGWGTKTPVVKYESKDREVVEQLLSDFGMSYKVSTIDPRYGHPNWSVTYRTQISGGNAMRVIRTIFPYIRMDRKITAALNLMACRPEAS